MSKNVKLPRDKKIKLSQYDPDDTGSFSGKDEVAEHYEKLKEELTELQDKLFAGKKYSLLIIFQGMDCSGKDGVIKKVLSGVNPQGFKVTSFKQPTTEESSHDFLWRAHKETPGRGFITAFNRSYYEDVLITRVHNQIEDEEAERRFKHIKQFEKLLADHDTVVLKIFLHISKDFQIKKIEERLHDPSKRWKFDPSDLLERNYWDAYQKAYEGVFTNCNSKDAPWHLVPGNNRWYRDYVVLSLIVDTLKKLPLSYPQPDIAMKDLIELLPLGEQPE
ncbi:MULTISPECIES: PPK2 family polyphosphate kinase [Paenibacillus]|uniref:Polyphosphate kinase 2 family protein n=1 Tax=Paenibacillus baimaensis TaxID=2982185 RepID=A0ABT2UUK4_9BACL|nr:MULTISPECIES: PPK2 family polyphosphate kinase [unclassified Paenibacillus]MCU6798300.1 polyphosphate kinase 2 family protein [Paenibacillus sp. WQ 127069]OMF03911.1 polyphosphate kinase [Paenibacillus sp. FSL H7-0331]